MIPLCHVYLVRSVQLIRQYVVLVFFALTNDNGFMLIFVLSKPFSCEIVLDYTGSMTIGVYFVI